MKTPAPLQLHFFTLGSAFPYFASRNHTTSLSWKSPKHKGDILSQICQGDISLQWFLLIIVSPWMSECLRTLIWHVHMKWGLKINAGTLSQMRQGLVFEMENLICCRPSLDATALRWARLRAGVPLLQRCDSQLFPHGFVLLTWMHVSPNYWLNLLVNVPYQRVVEQSLPQAGAWLWAPLWK